MVLLLNVYQLYFIIKVVFDKIVEGEQALETHKEEMVGNLHISRIHFQLRRMKRNSNYSDNVFLTAIPERRSKVPTCILAWSK